MENQLQLSENYENKYQHYEHIVGTIMLHLEWCTKYRYKMFRKEENKNLLCACIRRAASLHEIKIIELNVQPEHIHCVVLVKFSVSVSQVLQILKGISAKLFFEHQSKARLRYPRGHLWSRGKFASSVGFVQLDVVRNYVRTQEEHH
ncbi:MAG: IS200/IS605 family transposase [Nanoarchaeota archaeon]